MKTFRILLFSQNSCRECLGNSVEKQNLTVIDTLEVGQNTTIQNIVKDMLQEVQDLTLLLPTPPCSALSLSVLTTNKKFTARKHNFYLFGWFLLFVHSPFLRTWSVWTLGRARQKQVSPYSIGLNASLSDLRSWTLEEAQGEGIFKYGRNTHSVPWTKQKYVLLT